MEENGIMTVEDVLRISNNILGEISIPAKYAEQIAKPISQVMSNLKLCIEAEEKQRAEAARAEAEKAKEEAEKEEGDGGEA